MLKKPHLIYIVGLLSLFIGSCGDKKSSDSVEPIAVNITYPIENSKIARDVPFRATIESLEGIESAKFFIDDSLIVSDTIAPYETNINSIDFDDGSYQLSVLARDAKERESADTIMVDIFNDPKAPNPIKIDSISYSYANRKLQIYLPVSITGFEYFRMITDNGNTTDTLSYNIFENVGLSVLSVDNYEPDQNKVFNTYVCNEFELCTKGDPYEYYNLLSYEISFSKESEIMGITSAPCGSSDCFSITGRENSDGMHRLFSLDGRELSLNGLVDKRIGDGRGSVDYRHGNDIIYDEGSYIITGQLDEQSSAKAFISIENDQGFSAFTFKEFGDGYGVSAIRTSLNDYLIAGNRTIQNKAGIFFARFSNNLIFDDAKSFPYVDGSLNMKLESAKEASGGNYLSTGYLYDNNNSTLFVQMNNASGDTLWRYTPNLESDFTSIGKDLIQLINGDIIVAGQVNFRGSKSILIIRLNSLGELIWTSYFNDSELSTHLLYLNDDNIILGGYGFAGSFLISVDGNGRKNWIQKYSSMKKLNAFDRVGSGFVLVGQSYSDRGMMIRAGILGEIK